MAKENNSGNNNGGKGNDGKSSQSSNSKSGSDVKLHSHVRQGAESSKAVARPPKK